MILKNIIEEAAKELSHREAVRDQVLSRARKARMLSKQAILYLHNRDTENATQNLDKASQLLKEISEYSDKDQEIQYYDAVIAARQEYSEAKILYQLNTANEYPEPEKLGVSTTDYILGLADVPGELRRQTLDLLREEKLEQAKINLDRMEEIYLHLLSMEEVSLLLKGLRRKLDVIRSVTERTRAEITSETSRQKLIEELRRKE